MSRTALLALLALALPAAHAGPQEEAFAQAGRFGSSANASARGRIANGTPAQVPGYSGTPPEAAHFGQGSLGAAAAAKLEACGASGSPTGSSTAGEPGAPCQAARFSQHNPQRRAPFSLTREDPLQARARTITADPQAIAGSLAGTYSGCTVETVAPPAAQETRTCHATRHAEQFTCERILVPAAVQVPGCTPGQFLARAEANPCADCSDTVVFEFACAAGGYRLHVFTVDRESGLTFMELGVAAVPGSPGATVARTPGPSEISRTACYRTWYEQSCGSSHCTLGVAFANPCQDTHHEGRSRFPIPTTTAFRDDWVNQCAALEARAR